MGCGSSAISQQAVNEIIAKSEGKITEKDIQHWNKIWKKIAPNGKMTCDQFVDFIVENKIGNGSAYDARNMFKVMDQDKNGYMEFAEFVLLLIRPTTAEEMSPDQFASLCIQIYDEDGDGVINKDELLRFAFAKAKAEGRTTRAHRDQIEEVVNKIITYIDSNSDGKITKEELVTAIQKDPYLKKIL